MIGKKLSPVLEEMEATLWEYEAFNGGKTELHLRRVPGFYKNIYERTYR